MIDRLHHYIRELRMRRKSMEAVKKQNRSFEDGKVEETKALETEVSTLQEKLKQLQSELEVKSKEVNTSEANAAALSKQSEGFLLEYDRLLEENQNLRSQLQSMDLGLSRSTSKKNTWETEPHLLNSLFILLIVVVVVFFFFFHSITGDFHDGIVG